MSGQHNRSKISDHSSCTIRGRFWPQFLRRATKLGQGYVFTGVCDSVHRGGMGLPQCMLGYHPQSRHPPSKTPPGSRHPLEQTPPWSRHPPRADTPPEQTPPGTEHAGRFSQCAGGKHPTGMQSCLFSFLEYILIY